MDVLVSSQADNLIKNLRRIQMNDSNLQKKVLMWKRFLK